MPFSFYMTEEVNNIVSSDKYNIYKEWNCKEKQAKAAHRLLCLDVLIVIISNKVSWHFSNFLTA